MEGRSAKGHRTWGRINSDTYLKKGKMKITIYINCETIRELRQHLHVIDLDIKRAARRQGKDSPSDTLDHLPIHWTDNNCYGTHDAFVEK